METNINELVKKLDGQALNYQVILKELSVENLTASGFALDTSKEKYSFGVVISVGSLCPKDDKETHQTGVNVGDRVIYQKHGASELTRNGEKFQVVLFADLVMVN